VSRPFAIASHTGFNMTATASPLLRVTGGPTSESRRVLTPDALAFVARLDAEFGERRLELLRRRTERWQRMQHGKETLGFARGGPAQGEWRVASVPKDLDDRRVEITGPAEAKMMINAL